MQRQLYKLGDLTHAAIQSRAPLEESAARHRDLRGEYVGGQDLADAWPIVRSIGRAVRSFIIGRSFTLQPTVCTLTSPVDVSARAKQDKVPEFGDRHHHGEGGTRQDLQWGVCLQLPACPGDHQHQRRECQRHWADQQAADRHRPCCVVDMQADLEAQTLCNELWPRQPRRAPPPAWPPVDAMRKARAARRACHRERACQPRAAPGAPSGGSHGDRSTSPCLPPPNHP